MRRGTTPTLSITVSGISVSDLKTIKVTLEQGGIELTKVTSEVTVNPDTNSISVPLTQEDTLLFKAGDVCVQVRGLMDDDTTAIASVVKSIPMEKILLDGVITADGE